MDGGIEVVLGELIEIVQATAPALWAIARRQVFANTVGTALWAGLCILFTAMLAYTARYSERRSRQVSNDYSTGWYLVTVFSVFLACITAIVALACFNNLVMYSINPDYYAIKVLLGLVR